ncbi:MAG: ABC transporter permease [Thermomicrobiales bacterium]|nr:ABC transporter permease [Thermomicrobiales bacterium]
MSRYIVRRFVLLIPTLFGVTFLVFALMRFLPGDVVNSLLGTEATFSEEQRATLRRLLGLDQPIYVQYLDWLRSLARLDLGVSFRSSEPVLQMVIDRASVTIELALLSVIVSTVIAVPLGVITATHRGNKADVLAHFVGLVGLSIPSFWLAILLLLVTTLYIPWSPKLIWINPLDDPVQNLKQMVLPVIALSLSLVAVVMRMTRSSMLETLGQDYVRTARAKGLRERLVVLRHALRNALIPVVTVIGLQIGNLLGGAVVIEQIFGLPGIGSMILTAINQRDYPVVQGGVLFVAIAFLLINLCVDLLYVYIDPRIRY